MKKIKQVFPSRNYITVDSFGDVEVIFNPVGDGFEGDDKLMFRKGRWAFRVNDFLAGKTMADGSKEGMGRKVYSLNLVYNDEDGEPIVNTTYVDPTSVIPLDGSLVDVVGSEKLAQEETVQTLAKDRTVKGISDKVATETTLQTLAKDRTVKGISDKVATETTLQTLAKESTLNSVLSALIDASDFLDIISSRISTEDTLKKFKFDILDRYSVKNYAKTIKMYSLLNGFYTIPEGTCIMNNSSNDFFVALQNSALYLSTKGGKFVGSFSSANKETESSEVLNYFKVPKDATIDIYSLN